MKKKIAVAMSGGVDSSLTAALLLEEGYDVIGITLQLWVDGNEDVGTTPAVEDAKKMCDFLHIPHHVIDARDAFHDSVVEYFIREYSVGRTPNPCVFCNKNIKFTYLLDKAVELSADYLVTGHYAQVRYNEDSGLYEIHKGDDSSKDQSYVLYTANQDILSKLLLPLGSQHKTDTRAMAVARNLPVANKPDSQEICFIPDNNYKKFLEKDMKVSGKKGKIVHKNGEILGVHDGLYHYTIGQRKGLGIAYKDPLYVIRLDKERNEVIVGDNEDLFTTTLYCEFYNFLSGKIPTEMTCEGKIRYGAHTSICHISILENSTMRVIFDEPQRAITPGQSVVFYDGTQLLGGGVIDRLS